MMFGVFHAMAVLPVVLSIFNRNPHRKNSQSNNSQVNKPKIDPQHPVRVNEKGFDNPTRSTLLHWASDDKRRYSAGNISSRHAMVGLSYSG